MRIQGKPWAPHAETANAEAQGREHVWPLQERQRERRSLRDQLSFAQGFLKLKIRSGSGMGQNWGSRY